MCNIQSKTLCVNGKNVLYFRAYFKCPVCEERGIHSEQSYWYHGGGCGGDIYIGSDANYYCDTCGHKSISPVMEWGYRCPDHNGKDNDGQYVGVGDITVLAQVIGTCMSLVTMTGNLWLAELLVNLESQRGVTYTGGR